MSEYAPRTGLGGFWVVAQFVLMVGCAVLGLTWADQWAGTWQWVPAIVAAVGGAALGISGVHALGRNRTVFPEPRPGSVLVRHGVYRQVRHPLYASVMLLAVAWGLWCRSVPAIMGSGVLMLFLVLKARNEEARLLRRFPSYAAYRAATRRFIPWII